MRVFGKAHPTAAEQTYANSFSYTASGGISRMKLGNGRWETAKFNDRLQVEELGLGTLNSDASLWKVKYDYGELDANGDIADGKNTGNIGKITLSFAGLANPVVQRFKYDSLYRLTEATERSGTAITSTPTWTQNFGYDRFGNRMSLSQNIGGIAKNTTPSIDPSTNRFNTGQGFSYDANGNIINDVSDINQARSFVFNAENKQIEVRDANGSPIGKYFYDGENRRVKKVTDAETTIFVYSSGKLVAEYSTKTPPQNPTTSYTTTDHLGTPRVITDALGQVKSRRDFMPFGEELTINVGERSQGLKYGNPDDIRQKFTGYQKDEETKLDFAEARMYENRHARFTAVDPLLASGKSANPQTFNRYAYTMNRPLVLTDPSGLCTPPPGLQPGQVGICFEAFIAAPRIGPGGIAHGDGRTFSGDNPDLTARITVWAIVSTGEKIYSAVKSGENIEPGVVGRGSVPIPLQGTADTNVTSTNNGMVQGEKDFGEKGVDVTISISNGTNGFQQLGRDAQTAGAVTAASSPTTAGQIGGAIVNGVGRAVEEASPAGTIDGSATLRITGNGNVTYVAGETRPYPSYAVYAYTVAAEGEAPKIVYERERPETPPVENLTKPKTAW